MEGATILFLQKCEVNSVMFDCASLKGIGNHRHVTIGFPLLFAMSKSELAYVLTPMVFACHNNRRKWFCTENFKKKVFYTFMHETKMSECFGC